MYSKEIDHLKDSSKDNDNVYVLSSISYDTDLTKYIPEHGIPLIPNVITYNKLKTAKLGIQHELDCLINAYGKYNTTVIKNDIHDDIVKANYVVNSTNPQTNDTTRTILLLTKTPILTKKDVKSLDSNSSPNKKTK